MMVFVIVWRLERVRRRRAVLSLHPRQVVCMAWQGQLRSAALNDRSAGGPEGEDAQEGDGSGQPPRQAAGPAGRAVWLARLATIHVELEWQPAAAVASPLVTGLGLVLALVFSAVRTGTAAGAESVRARGSAHWAETPPFSPPPRP